MDMIGRRFGGFGLKAFLQFPFGIIQIGDIFQLAERFAELPENKFGSRFKSAVQKNAAHQRFESIRQVDDLSRPPLRSSPRLRMRCWPRFSLRACSASVRRFTIWALALVNGPSSTFGKFFIQLTGYDQLQNRVAEEFQTLVMLTSVPLSCATEG